MVEQHRRRGQACRPHLRYFLDVGGVEVRCQREVEAPGRGRLQRIAQHEIHALGARIHAVDEEAAAADADEALAVQELAHWRGREVLRQHDAIVDIDAIGIDGEIELAEAQHRAHREVRRLLRIQVRGTERTGHRIARREGRDFHETHAGNVVRGRRLEELLLQRGRAETVLHGAAQREVLVEVITHRQLAGEVVAEIRIALAAHGNRCEQGRRQVRLEVDIGAHCRPILIDLVRRPEARKHLRAGRGGIAVRQPLAAVAVRIRLAGEDRVRLASCFETDCHIERRSEGADLHRTHAGDVQHQLVVVEAAGIELRLAGRSDRAIERVIDRELHLVQTVDQRAVHLPRTELPACAEGSGVVRDVGGDQRQEAVRIDRRDVARVAGRTIEAGADRVPVLPARPAVERDLIGDVVARIREQRLLRQFGLAVPGVEAIERRLARVGHAIHDRILRPMIPTAAFGVLLILVLGRHGEKTRVRQRQALPDRRRQCFTVTPATGQHRRSRPCRTGRRHWCSPHVEIGIAPAIGHIRTAAFACFAQAEIDHASDGIGAVLGRCAVA